MIASDLQNLGGTSSRINIQTMTPGKAPLGGTFALRFRSKTSNASLAVAYNATASEMKAKLESIPSILEVAVTRSDAVPTRSFSWTVTFKRVAFQTTTEFVDDDVAVANSYVLDTNFNLRPISVDASLVTGTDASVQVTYLYEQAEHHYKCRSGFRSCSQQIATSEVRGSFGSGAGAAYIFIKEDEKWTEQVKLRGTDTASNDRFGHDVTISADTVVVGAPFAKASMQNEIQKMTCQADGGTFRISFRGHATEDINFDATLTELEAKLEAIESIGDVTVTSLNPVSCGADDERWEAAGTPVLAVLSKLTSSPLFFCTANSLGQRYRDLSRIISTECFGRVRR